MTLFKIFKVIFAIFFSIIVFQNNSNALPPLTIVTDNWRPYNYQDTDLSIKGESTDKVRKVLSQAGYKEVFTETEPTLENTFNIKAFPWSRTYALAQGKPNVMIYTIIRVEQREKLFKWVCKIGKKDHVSLYK